MTVPDVPYDTAEGLDVQFSELPFLAGVLAGILPGDQSVTGAYTAMLGKLLGPSVAGAVQSAYVAGGGVQ